MYHALTEASFDRAVKILPTYPDMSQFGRAVEVSHMGAM